MPGNFFTKPHGLHPTPSACYPPPPPGQPPYITGGVFLGPVPIFIGAMNDTVSSFTNTTLPPGDPLTIIWTEPGFADLPPAAGLNGIEAHHPSRVIGPSGSYSGTAKVTWSNGQTRTFPFTYKIE